MYIPGFRSKKTTKITIAIIYYVFSLLMLFVGISYSLFLISLPFIVFYGIDLLKYKQKKLLVPFIASVLVFVVSIIIFPTNTPKIDADSNTSNTSGITQADKSISDNEPTNTTVASEDEPDIAKENNKNVVVDEGTANEESIANKGDTGTTLKENITDKDKDKTNPTATVQDESKKEVSGNIKVHFLDVGQADCILIQTSNNKNMLIDAGNNDDSSFILSYLNNLGIEKIDIAVGTHPHEDHIGSLDDVIKTFGIGKVYMPKVEHSSQTYLDVLTAIKGKELKVTTPVAGEYIDFDIDTKVQILAPNSDKYDNLNDYSIVVRLEYGNTSFLFTGDAETVSEQEIVSKKYNINSDVLKVGHHGSTTSSSLAFIKAVSPKYSVISVGKDNKYGHPDSIIINRFKMFGEVLRTDESGTIIITSDGEKITIEKKASSIKENAPPEESQEVNKPAPSTQEEPSKQEGIYIGNINSKIFHRETCTTLPDQKNQVKFNNREEAIDAGYTGCKRCNP
ncbi:MAG TPA: MBL fold metallo-hydrolase [Clostridiales bacterium]|nr:MBL fold metallo-hydrolase [Clostridiales bacterium]